MPKPAEGETEQEYVSRFMESEETRRDYPDQKQRAAVAYSMWRDRSNTLENQAYGWPKLYKCRFIEPGVVFYQDLGPEGETILVQKDALDKMLKTFVGRPVINMVHKDVTPDTVAKGEADGVVSRVWYGDDGWYWAEFIVWDERTQRNCESNAYSVSCAYEPQKVGGGGTYHNMEYQEEVLDGEYTHLAVVANPRYEGARIFVNSKGGSMNWKFWNKEKKNAADLDPLKTMVDVDGEKVSLQQLYDAVKPEKSALEMSDDTTLEVDGKEHTLKQLKDAHRAKNAAAKGEEAKKPEEKKPEEPEKKNDVTEEAAKKTDAETKEKAPLERQQEAEPKKDEEKKEPEPEKKETKENAVEPEKKEPVKTKFDELRHSARTRSGGPVGIQMVTPEDRVALGNKRYGSAPKA